MPCIFQKSSTYFEDLVNARHGSVSEGIPCERTELTCAFSSYDKNSSRFGSMQLRVLTNQTHELRAVAVACPSRRKDIRVALRAESAVTPGRYLTADFIDFDFSVDHFFTFCQSTQFHYTRNHASQARRRLQLCRTSPEGFPGHHLR